ncbi:hypothetical protein MAQ5080_00848 [Marinomonas aquimarina]|uniref:Uncharacterized protein n=1 Tax=Marinomonas aquimarina TaxID=295068 RepID=A0A1A8T602_9GAMM|nr:hypothetical protein [Marinomonas aquimarina]SBS27540.1 hypothetical protein MAQ5080_00848 [Marinomonas aquimarina]
MRWLQRIGVRWLGRKQPLPKLIMVGIDTHCYQLAQALIQQREADIIAFIDDEPWTNRTELLGAKVYYPSDMVALVMRNEVQLIVDFAQSNMVPESIKAELEALPVQQLCLTEKATGADLALWREQVLQCLASSK